MNGLTPIKAARQGGVLLYGRGFSARDAARFRSCPDLFWDTPGEESDLCRDDKGHIYLYDWAEYTVEAQDEPFEEEEFRYKGRYVTARAGLLKFQNRMGEAFFRQVHVTVLSRKLSLEAYREMAAYTDRMLSATAWSFCAGTYGRMRFMGEKDTRIPYHKLVLLLTWLRAEQASENLKKLCVQIAKNPVSRLREQEEQVPVGMAEELDPDGVERLVSDGGLLRPCAVSTRLSRALGRGGVCRLPDKVHTLRVEETYDCPENRFVKHFLKRCMILLGQFRRNMGEEVERERRALSGLLNEPLFRGVGELSYLPGNSTALHHRAGYAQLFQMYLKFMSTPAPVLSEEKLARYLEQKDVNVIYEFFCFFTVYELMCGLYAGDPEVSLAVRETRWEVSLGRDQGADASCIRFAEEGALPKVELYYNKTYSGRSDVVSHPMRPDLSLEVAQDSGRRIILVFDAKFRLNTDGRTFKNEDIDKMHTYRDAIRDVLGAFVLYPGERNCLYHANHEAPQDHDGVGVFALRPGDMAQRHALGAALDTFLRTVKGAP